MKEEDKIVENWMRHVDEPNFNEAIPEAFLTDINQRLDAMEKGRKRKLGGWIWFSIFFFSAFIAVAAWVGLKNQVQITQLPKGVDNAAQPIQTKASQSHVNTKVQDLSLVQPNEFKGIQLVKKLPKTKQASIEKDGANLNQNNNLLLIESELLSTDKVVLASARPEEFMVEEPVPNEKQAIDSVINTSKLDSTAIQEQPTKKTKKITWEAGFSFGVSGILSSFEVPSSTDPVSLVYSASAYRNAREQQERSTTSWDVSLRIKMLVNHFTFQSGLDYFQWGEQVKYDFNSISGINRYSYLNVPLHVGYDFKMKKFGFNPFAGASVGYCLQRNGQYLMPDLQHVSEEKAKQMTGTLSLGAEIAYYSESGIKVFVMPIWRKSIGKVVESGSIFNKYQSIGVQMGISVGF